MTIKPPSKQTQRIIAMLAQAVKAGFLSREDAILRLREIVDADSGVISSVGTRSGSETGEQS